MIVDDEPINLYVIDKFLGEMKIKTLMSNNGLDCYTKIYRRIENCKDKKCSIFRFIIMDYQMPLMDGAETTKKILKLF